MDTDSLYSGFIEPEYGEFSRRLTKNVDYPYLGVRVPTLKRIAASLDDFPYSIKWHEDVLLRGFWIASRKIPFHEKTEMIISHVASPLETWDEVDTFVSALKVKEREKEEAYRFFRSFLSKSGMERRYGVVSLMANRKLYKERWDEILGAIVKADSIEYYNSMAVAWAIATFAADGMDVLPFFDALSDATRKRAMQKIRDSRRC